MLISSSTFPLEAFFVSLDSPFLEAVFDLSDVISSSSSYGAFL